MKFFVMIAAGLMGAATLAPTTATAAPIGGDTRVVVRQHTVVRHNDRRRHGWATRRVCNKVWYHGRKITRCRTVRYRR